MGWSDCIECGQTPCICGHDYKGWDTKRKDGLVKAVQGFTTHEFVRWIQRGKVYPSDTIMQMGYEEMLELFLKDKDE